MKLFKRLMAVMFALTLTLGMGTTSVFAEPNTHTITNGSTTHSYEIYQIFTGTYDSETKQLKGLKYGANAVGTAGAAVSAADMKKLSEYSDAGSTQALDQKDIAFISQFVKLDSTAYKTIAKDAANKSVEVEEGYYLIKDVDDSLAGTDESYTLYLISVLNEDITITPKTGTTTSVKKVDDVNDSTGKAENMQDSADYDIGDFVPFHLSATIAQNVSAYKKYHLTFTDTLESGKFDEITAPVIKVGGTPLAEIATTAGYKVTENYTTQPSASGFVVTVTFEPTSSTEAGALLPDVLSGETVTIDFTAKLGTGANIGQMGNVNTLQLKYSNNPNSTDDSEEGTTPEDTVIVFTYDLIVNKTDEAGNALNGATFALYKKYTDAQLTATGKTAVTEIKYDNDAKTYTIPSGTNYVQVGSNISGASTNIFTFTGVDDGEYLLVEVKAPTGYNCLEPKTFSITATHTATADIDKTTKKDAEGKYVLTSVSGTGQIELAQHTTSGVIDGLSSTVENKSGTTLPSTGGIGTTIFYVLGGLLVAGAGIVLVARKKASE